MHLLGKRQREGIEIAKKKGKFRGTTKKLNAEKIETLKKELLIRKSKSQIAAHLGISRFTLYRYIDQIKKEDEKNSSNERQS